jgi:hypothetical protein
VAEFRRNRRREAITGTFIGISRAFVKRDIEYTRHILSRNPSTHATCVAFELWGNEVLIETDNAISLPSTNLEGEFSVVP